MDHSEAPTVASSICSKSSRTSQTRSTHRQKRKSRRASEASLVGATLKSILKRKGDQTAGKKSIALRKSSIKFNKFVSTRAQSDGQSDDDSSFGNVGNRRPISIAPHQIAKSVIENTLLKSADVLCDFTENTISKAASYINSFIASDRFRIQSPYRQKRSRPWNASSVTASVAVCNLSAQQRRRPDVRNLPKNIIELLKSDSESSLDAPETSKQYHSRKMALRQGNLSNRAINTNVILKTYAETRAPEILLVSAPITRLSYSVKDDSSKVSNYNERGYQEPSASEAEAEMSRNAPARSKNPKRPDTPLGVNKSLRKPQKVHLGVDKGVAFVIGPKTKAPYSNTFGEDQEIDNPQQNISSRKWVFNIGNFKDNEISFSLLEKNLTITGFRHPTLQYPDGQTVSQVVTTPVNFEVKNIRIYRPTTAGEILILEETKK